MEAINCIFCHIPSNTIALQENGYEGKQCSACNLIFVSPRPSQAEIANVYGHDQAYIPAHAHINQEYSKRLQAKHALNIIKKYCNKGSLLELGSGAGYFLDEAKKQGFEPYGIELNPAQAEFIRTKLQLPCLETLFDNASFGQKTFDIIYHSDVLSHFYDPITAFNTMHTKLNPGGYIVFETGNIADITPNYYKVFTKFQYPDHLFFFGEKTIRQLLEITGFECVTIHRYSILAQLMLNKYIANIRTISPTHVSQNQTNNKVQQSVSYKNNITHVLKKGYHTVSHLLRYSVGKYLPKTNRPQTVIVVAKKVNL